MVIAVAFGDDALGLLDDDPRLERALELRRHHERIVQRPFLQDADRGDVGERLRDLAVFGAEGFGTRREDVERADHFASQSHRQCGHRFEADVLRVRSEARPARVRLLVERNVHRVPHQRPLTSSRNVFSSQAI